MKAVEEVYRENGLEYPKLAGVVSSVPAMPTMVQVGPYRCPVVFDQAAIDRERASAEDGSIRGRFRYAHHTIAVAPDQSRDNQAAALLHEVLHAVWFAAGGETGKVSDERAVTILYGLLLDTLRRNPALVAFLVAEGE